MNHPEKKYDVIIVGGGPAGLSAGIYTGRARLRSLLIDKAPPGGRIIDSESVENYPGFPEGISGLELTELMTKQAAKFGLEILTVGVTGLELKDKQRIVKTTEGDFVARTVIIAAGSDHVQLGVPGEKEFTGKGVSYCATCDAYFHRDKPVAVVGGGNAAVHEALQLTKFASKITLIHRRGELRATRIVQENAFAEPKIKLLWNTVVEAVEGESMVERLRLRNVLTKDKSALDISGVFVAIGLKPSTDCFKEVLPLDNAGFIVTNEKMETGISGIFAAGDIRANSIRQVISAAGDGAVAAISAEKLLTTKVTG